MALDKKMNQVVKDNGRFILEAISLVLKVSKGGSIFQQSSLTSWLWLLGQLLASAPCKKNIV